MDGKEIAKILLETYRSIYGTSSADNIFAGGNAGMVAIALAIEKLADSLNTKIYLEKLMEEISLIKREEER